MSDSERERETERVYKFFRSDGVRKGVSLFSPFSHIPSYLCILLYIYSDKVMTSSASRGIHDPYVRGVWVCVCGGVGVWGCVCV